MTFPPSCQMWQFNSHVERERSCSPSNQTNGDMCFLSLLATHDGWINTGANTGNFHSHIFTHALRLHLFFQVAFTGETIFGNQGPTGHARVSVHGRKYYWRRPSFSVSLNTAPRDIFRLFAGAEALCHYRASRQEMQELFTSVNV